MNLLSNQSLLGIVAVVDVALFSESRPVSATALAERHQLPPRYLEALLQEFVRRQILRGVRGPGGGYRLAQERQNITVGQIVRIAETLNASNGREIGASSPLLNEFVLPRIRNEIDAFLNGLDCVTVEDMCAAAVKLKSAKDLAA